MQAERDEMTDKELDEARIAEARRLTGGWATHEMFRHIARLTREGWTPDKSILIEAREIAAQEIEAAPHGPWRNDSNYYRHGLGDQEPGLRAVVRGIKRGIEIGKAQA